MSYTSAGPGLSSQFSGDGFSDMRFLVHAVPTSEFEGWLARTRGEGSALNADAYSQLARAGAVTAEVLAARVRIGDMAALRQIGDRFEFAHATLP